MTQARADNGLPLHHADHKYEIPSSETVMEFITMKCRQMSEYRHLYEKRSKIDSDRDECYGAISVARFAGLLTLRQQNELWTLIDTHYHAAVVFWNKRQREKKAAKNGGAK